MHTVGKGGGLKINTTDFRLMVTDTGKLDKREPNSTALFVELNRLRFLTAGRRGEKMKCVRHLKP